MVADAELDVSGWKIVGEEVLGTKPKRWLVDPSEGGDFWLMKDRTFSVGRAVGKYAKGDDWAEYIAARVAADMRIPAASVKLAVRRVGNESNLGIVSRTVLSDSQDLVLGNQLLSPLRASSDAWDMKGYTPELVREALEHVVPPAESDGSLGAWELFVCYLVLDALVGNTDRHPENWGVIDAGDSSRRVLAPSFDHASSLGFQLSDDDKADRLSSKDGRRTPEWWAKHARTPFEGKPGATKVASDALATLGRSDRANLLDRIPSHATLEACIAEVPASRMSDVGKEFATRMILANADRLVMSV